MSNELKRLSELNISCNGINIALNDFVDILGGKWRFPIIFTLYFRDMNFSELKKHLSPITSRSLSQNLSSLEENQLVQKQEGNTQYSLTEYADGLKGIVSVINEFQYNQCPDVTEDTLVIEKELNEAMKEVFRELAGKWRMIIMGTLLYGKCTRFSELKAVIPNISGKELTRNLNSLVDSEIVERYRIEGDAYENYRISDKGKLFEKILGEMIYWTIQHKKHLSALF